MLERIKFKASDNETFSDYNIQTLEFAPVLDFTQSNNNGYLLLNEPKSSDLYGNVMPENLEVTKIL